MMHLLEGPARDALPAPLWLLTSLHVLTLTLHLLAMNALLGGLAVTLFSRLEGRWNNQGIRRMVKSLPTLMAVTVSLGVAPLLFAQVVHGPQIYSASIVSGWFWLAIPLIAMTAYFLFYAAAFSTSGSRRARTSAWLSLPLLVIISLTYSSVFAMAEKPELQASLYAADQSGRTFNPELGAWLPRWLHMMTGAVTVGGFFFGVLGRKDERAFAAGHTTFALGTAAAVLTGFFYLLTLGKLGGPFMRSPGIAFLTLAIPLGIAAVFPYRARRFQVAGILVSLSVLGMVAARHVLRLVALRETYDPATLPVNPQWQLLWIFAGCLLLAIVLITWMVRALLRAPAHSPST